MLETYFARANEELEAARYLLTGGFPKEAASRAYYSMFHAAQALLHLRDIHPKTHAGVLAQFSKEFIVSEELEKVYIQTLARAETLRTKSDYDLEYSIDPHDVQEVVDSAERFLNKVWELVGQLERK